MTKLPIAIILPHASLEIPPELTDRIALTEEQIFNEADAYTDLIYDFRDRVVRWHRFPYARSIIDVNRASQTIQQMPIPIGDGIVKRVTSYGTDVYIADKEPNIELEQFLIKKYWQPWHDQLATIATDPSIKLVLDCHSMASKAPSHYSRANDVRPRISVSNLGDEEGNPLLQGINSTAPADLTRLVAQKFGKVLAGLNDFAPTSRDYAVNQPFVGGADLLMHGGRAQPWLMIELSRATYIGKQTGDSLISLPKQERIELIREKLWKVIVDIVEDL
ncbi:MAG: N-formylglutamate amidohydrolase [Chloroflexota bacterium]